MGRPSKYPPEFRREAVELVKTSERPRVEIARSLGISDNTLANWIAADREVQARSDDPNGLSETEREELRRLRKENIELRTDRKILRKAAAYFARGDAAVSRFRFVHDHRDTYQVKRLCQLVEVSRSGYYRRRRRPDIAPAPDRINRDFSAQRPNQRWVADITEFPTGEGKLHLAGVRDLCHRGLVGWSMGPRPDAELVVEAVVMAVGRAEPDHDGLVHHSDKGGAYVSGEFCSMADIAGLQVSFGSTGDCWDNVAMETFWSILTQEITWIRGSIWFETRHDARLYLFEFIEVFYNRQRHQAALGHRTPAEFAATFNP